MHQRRKILEGLERQKDEMIASIWANSAWDEATDKNARKNAIQNINDNYREAILAIEDAMEQVDRPEEEKIDESNPFFAAAERGLSQVMQNAKQHGYTPKSELEEEIDYMKDLDQE